MVKPIIFKGSIFTAAGAGKTDNVMLRVSGGIITDIGRNIDDPNAETVELEGCFLLPGFVDSHSHASEDSSREKGVLEQHSTPDTEKILRGYLSLRKDILSGVTTMRLLGDGTGGIDKTLNDMEKSGELDIPKILAAVLAIRPSHGTAPSIGAAADGADHVRNTVRAAISLGADVIKIFASNICRGGRYLDYLRGDLTRFAAYSRDEIFAAANEAHRNGVKIAAHCIGGPAMTDCLKAGVDSLEHANLMDGAHIQSFLDSGAYISDPNLILFSTRNTAFKAAKTKRTNGMSFPAGGMKRLPRQRKQRKRLCRSHCSAA